MKINKKELPSEFKNATIIENIAITSNGKQYAYVENDNLYVKNMPSNGELQIGDKHITYKSRLFKGPSITMTSKNSKKNISRGGIYTSGKGVSISNVRVTGKGNSISIGNGSINITSGDLIEQKIDEHYDSIKKIEVKSSVDNIILAFSKDEKIYLEGSLYEKPEVKDGILSVRDYNGTVYLPKDNEKLEIMIKNSTGNISGNVAHSGIIKNSVGNIVLSLCEPLIVTAKSNVGDVDIINMLKTEKRTYAPVNEKTTGNLELKSSTGNIKVNYVTK